jgi:hypothetical protein
MQKWVYIYFNANNAGDTQIKGGKTNKHYEFLLKNKIVIVNIIVKKGLLSPNSVLNTVTQSRRHQEALFDATNLCFNRK